MTIKNLYPKSRPQTIYNVINGRPELPAASTFSRASEATYTDSAGVIRTAAVDEPRFTYDFETGGLRGLLIDEARQNNLRWSNNFDGADGAWWSLFFGTNEGLITSKTEQAPDLTDTASILVRKSGKGAGNLGLYYTQLPAGNPVQTQSIFVKKMPGSSVDTVTLLPINGGGTVDGVTVNLDTGEFTLGRTIEEGSDRGVLVSSCQKLANGWYRLSTTAAAFSNYNDTFYCYSTVGGGGPNPEGEGFLLWGACSAVGYATEFINSSGSPGTVAQEFFSLTTSSNFDSGFSLLLDSETTTQDFLYRIKAGGTVISELKNDGGTLEWDVNGTSAQSDGLYPQVGFVNGRVRTVSSYGAADGTVQNNYLYTTGISFPTPAVVAPAADELEFGVPQTLKALYLWNGQLSDAEAVSVIKGEYNVVPNEPIKTDSYSFVRNTDPSSVGKTLIDVPGIIPKTSMRIYWGDGRSDRYEPDVIPQHTYPYPGQYRIQIVNDDGYEKSAPNAESNSITRVDQWPPEYREGASGAGYTGSDLKYYLYQQRSLTEPLPRFKYSGLTDLTGAFFELMNLDTNDWDWVPYNIPEVTSLLIAYYRVGYNTLGVNGDNENFPQLITGPGLTTVRECFYESGVRKWVDRTNGNSPTNRPFTDTSNVTDWSNCFNGCGITDISVDTKAAITLENTFARNQFASFPNIALDNCVSLVGTWSSNKVLTSFPLLNTSSCTNLSSAWNGCEKLTSFPLVNTSSCTNFSYAWQDCIALTSFPSINTSSGTNFRSAWLNCNQLTSFPLIDTSSGNSFIYAWYNCNRLTSFPLIDTSSVTTFALAWKACSGLTSFPLIDTSSGNDFTEAWHTCNQLTSFPLIDTSSGTSFSNSWRSCSSLTSFPLIDTSSGTTFALAWYACTNLTNFPLLDTSSGTNFQTAWALCRGLTSFPANMFDTTGTLTPAAFQQTWQNCALTAQSIENILVSLDTNGQSNIELGIDLGTNAAKTTWTAAANTAYTNLIGKGWTITFNA